MRQCCRPCRPRLGPLASTKPDRLAVLLQLRNQLIPLLHHILVLLVLVIWPVGFNNALARYTIDCAWDAATGDELGQVPKAVASQSDYIEAIAQDGVIRAPRLPVQEIHCDTEIVRHALQAHDAIALQ